MKQKGFRVYKTPSRFRVVYPLFDCSKVNMYGTVPFCYTEPQRVYAFASLRENEIRIGQEVMRDSLVFIYKLYIQQIHTFYRQFRYILLYYIGLCPLPIFYHISFRCRCRPVNKHLLFQRNRCSCICTTVSLFCGGGGGDGKELCWMLNKLNMS